MADLNGDGKLDLLVGNGQSVGVLIGNGDGTFQNVVTYDSGGFFVRAVAVADVNGDGKPDVLVANGYADGSDYSGSVGVLLGTSSGTLNPVQSYILSGLAANYITVADLNGDNNPDLIVAACPKDFYANCTPSQARSQVLVFFGEGNGVFSNPSTYDSGGFQATSVSVADVNGDGLADIVVANACSQPCQFSGEGSLAVLLGSGNGGFQSPVTYDSGGTPFSVVVADVNNDGQPDLLVANFNCVGVLLGNRNGTFARVTTFATAFGYSLVVRDVDGDGKPDLVVADGYYSVRVLLGNGDGTFQPATIFASGEYLCRSVAVGDLNDDGKPDIVLASFSDSKVGVLLNATNLTGILTKTLIFSSRNPSFVGQPVNLTAIVTSQKGHPPDDENVVFNDGELVLGRAKLASGIASLSTSFDSPHAFTLTASYMGDSRFAPNISSGLSQTVKSTTKAVTTTSLTASLDPSTYGRKVVYTAKVTTAGSVPPTGSVKFTWSSFGQPFVFGWVPLGSDGIASAVRVLNAGFYPISAVYTGDANNLDSASPVLYDTVLQTKTAAAITSSLNPSTVGQAITFTAKITSPTVVPTGPVTFTLGQTTLGTSQLSGGKATFTTSSLPLGSNMVKVTYLGNSNIAKSSAVVTQVVHP